MTNILPFIKEATFSVKVLKKCSITRRPQIIQRIYCKVVPEKTTIEILPSFVGNQRLYAFVPRNNV